MSSPTQRTIKELKKAGGFYQIVEHFNHFSNTRRDLFGFLDLLHLDPISLAIVGIQVTGGGNLSARRTKILGERRDQAEAWLRCGGRILIHDWRKVKLKRGGKAMRWRCREVEITLKDFIAEVNVFS